MVKNSKNKSFGVGRLRLLMAPRFNPVVLGSIVAVLSGISYFVLTHSFAASTALYLAPSSGNVAPNGLLSVAIRISTDEQVRTVRATLPYPTSQLQYINTDGSGSAFSIDAGSPDNGGTLYITRTVPSGSSVTGDQLFTTVTFRVIASSGSIDLNINPYPYSLALRSSDNQNVLTSLSGGSYAIGSNAPPPPPPPPPPAVNPPPPPLPPPPPPPPPPPATVYPPPPPGVNPPPPPPVTYRTPPPPPPPSVVYHATTPPTPPVSPITKIYRALVPPPPPPASPKSQTTTTPKPKIAATNPTTTNTTSSTNTSNGGIDPNTGQLYDASQVDVSAGPQWPPTTIAAVAVFSTAFVIGMIWLGIRWWDRRRSY